MTDNVSESSQWVQDYFYTEREREKEYWCVFLYEKGSNVSFLLGQEFTKEEAISLEQKLEEDMDVVVELRRCGH